MSVTATAEKTQANTVKLTITVPQSDFEAAVEKAYLNVRKNVTIPGFRKGKAPRRVIENFYGGEAVFYEEAFDILFPDAYREAVEQTGIEPVDRPQISVDTIGEGNGLVFNAEVTVKPEVSLGAYKGIKVKKPEYNVTADAVDARIEEARRRVARWLDVEDRAVEQGDRITLDYQGFVDGVAFEGGTAQNQSLDIGSGRFIPGFEEQLVGMMPGEEKDITVRFPDDYHAEELKGKEAVFHVRVHKITRQELPALDDEFAKDVSEFDTLEAYREDVRRHLEEHAEERARMELENLLVEKAVENAQVDIPACMIDQQADRMVREMEYRMAAQGLRLEDYLRFTGSSVEQLREGNREEAARRVKTSLVLEAIKNAEGITATDEDIDQELERIAQERKLDVQQMKENLRPEDREYLADTILTRKVLELLKDNAEYEANTDDDEKTGE